MKKSKHKKIRDFPIFLYYLFPINSPGRQQQRAGALKSWCACGKGSRPPDPEALAARLALDMCSNWLQMHAFSLGFGLR